MSYSEYEILQTLEDQRRELAAYAQPQRKSLHQITQEIENHISLLEQEQDQDRLLKLDDKAPPSHNLEENFKRLDELTSKIKPLQAEQPEEERHSKRRIEANELLFQAKLNINDTFDALAWTFVKNYKEIKSWHVKIAEYNSKLSALPKQSEEIEREYRELGEHLLKVTEELEASLENPQSSLEAHISLQAKCRQIMVDRRANRARARSKALDRPLYELLLKDAIETLAQFDQQNEQLFDTRYQSISTAQNMRMIGFHSSGASSSSFSSSSSSATSTYYSSATPGRKY